MNQPVAHIHAIGTAVPDNDVHATFVEWADGQLAERRERALFRRMAERSGIAHRWSVLSRPIAPGGFYAGGRMPPTSERMKVYAREAPNLALAAIDALAEQVRLDGITHLVVASCTGFVAPGVDQIIAARLGLRSNVERTLVGFMGCYAAVAALRVAHHIARSEPEARILVVTVELSTLHLQPATTIEPLLAMLQFADGAAAALVTTEPAGIALSDFFAATLPDSDHLIRWTIGDGGFEMHLSGEVPGRIAQALAIPDLLPTRGGNSVWAVHAGGRSILDAVEHGLALAQDALAVSRTVLNRFGNMSSATLMFVLSMLMAGEEIGDGIAMAFGPGLAAEGFRFRERWRVTSLAERAIAEEQMDAVDLPASEYRKVLRDLAKVNRVTWSSRPTLAFLKRALGERKRFRLLDVGFGQGDMLRAIAGWAARRGISAELVGVDLNPNSEIMAREVTNPALPIRYLTGDVHDQAGSGYDFVVSSFVTHHMTPEQLDDFLHFMERESAIGWMVNDLHRHRFAYLGFPLLARLAGWHRIVREDGQLSIARSFRPAEWHALLAKAGLDKIGANVVRRFPFRLCVERIR